MVGEEAQFGRRPAFLPIEEGGRRGVDRFCYLLLPQAAVAPGPPEALAQGLWVSGESGLLFCPLRVTWQLVHEPLAVSWSLRFTA